MPNDLRQQRIRLAGDFYSSVDNNGVCVYCGDPATCLDHFVPISKVYHENSDYGLFLLPACTECNCMASAGLFETVADKQRDIKGKIKHQYRRLLKMPNWTEQEIGEMGCVMQLKIRADLTKKEWIKSRLSWTMERNFAAAFIAAIRSGLKDSGKGIVENPVGKMHTSKKDEELSLCTEIRREKKLNREFTLAVLREFGAEEGRLILKEVK